MEQTTNRTVLLDIRSCIDTDGDVDETLITTVGQFYRLGDDWYLSYQDQGDSPSDRTRTTIKVRPDGEVIIARSGSISGRILLRTGERTLFTYYTPYGELELTARSWETFTETDGRSGRLRLRYDIGTDDSRISENTIDITFKESAK